MGAVLTMSDLNARKQAELELSEAHQILNNLLTLCEKEIHKFMLMGQAQRKLLLI